MAEDKIPKGRIRRSAKLGSAIGGQATRYAGTKAANVARSSEEAERRLEARHLETAMKMAATLGEMKGAAMKIGQLASFIDTEFLPPEYAEIYQEQLAKLRTSAPRDAVGEGVARCSRRSTSASRSTSCSPRFEQEAFAAASIGQVHRATLHDGRAVAVKIQYPGVAEALESDLRNAGMIVRLARALAPGLDAKAVAEELRERVLEELDYEYEAQNQRTLRARLPRPPVHLRARRAHPPLAPPGAGHRVRRGRRLRGGQGARPGRARPLRRDRLPLLLRLDLPPAALQRRSPPRQLPPDGRRPGRLPRLRDDQAARPRSRSSSSSGRSTPRSRRDPEALREALHDLGFVKNPSKLDAERLMEHVMVVGGWYMEDREVELTPERVMKVIESTSDPRSEYYDLMRRESIPADELMGRRMETGVLAVLAQLRREAQLAPDQPRVDLRATRPRPSSASSSGRTSRSGASAACPGSRSGA